MPGHALAEVDAVVTRAAADVLADLVGAAPTAVSLHAAELRLAGLVENRREGTFVYYTVEDPALRALLAQALGRDRAATG